MKQTLAALALGLILWLPCTAAADAITDPMSDPFRYFNVYSLGNIGSSSQSYGSRIDGTVGAGGDAYFSNIALLGLDSDSGYLLHTGGSATLSGGSYDSGLDVGQDLTFGSLTVEGDVSVGGSVNVNGWDWATVHGDLSVAGGSDLPSRMTVSGATGTADVYTSMVDHLALSLFFKSTSEMVGNYESTGSVAGQWSTLTFTGTEGVNVVSIDADRLRSTSTFIIEAPEDAVVYINVTDADGGSVTLDWTGWTYVGGISAGNVLLNMPTTQSLYLTNGNAVNILAPFADTVFSSGTGTGSLVVGNLTGSGSMNLGHFEAGGSAVAGPAAVPEPGTMVLMLAGLAVLLAAGNIRRPRDGGAGPRLWESFVQGLRPPSVSRFLN